MTTSPAYTTVLAKNLPTARACGKAVVRATVLDGASAYSTVLGKESVVVLRDGVPVGGVWTGVGFNAYSYLSAPNGSAAVTAYASTKEAAIASFGLRLEAVLAR